MIRSCFPQLSLAPVSIKGAAHCRIEALVASTFAVPVTELRAATRRRARTAFARQAAMYLAHVALGLSFSEIGRTFGRDRTTAAHACHVVEDRRDDPRIDALLSRLECACQSLVPPSALLSAPPWPVDREVRP